MSATKVTANCCCIEDGAFAIDDNIYVIRAGGKYVGGQIICDNSFEDVNSYIGSAIEISLKHISTKRKSGRNMNTCAVGESCRETKPRRCTKIVDEIGELRSKRGYIGE